MRPNVVLIIILAAIAAVIAALVSMSGVKMVVLWTDRMIYILVLAIVVFAHQARHKEHLRAPWRHVARRPLAMSSLVILLFYVAVGLMDSVHFRQSLQQQQGQAETHYAGKVLSLLDLLTAGLRQRQEKTYSSPLSVYQFSKETVETEQGQTRIYPRLRFGGAHLKNPEVEKISDIAVTILSAVVQALLLLSFLLLALSYFLAGRSHQSENQGVKKMAVAILRNNTDIPWRAMFITLSVITVFIMMVVNLSANYHVLGTDKVGQDVLYLSLKSIRTGLVIGTLTTLIMLPFAIFLGIMAGYLKGWVDDVIQYIYTTLSSIPGVLLIAAAILSLQVYMANNPELFETVTERADLRLLFLCAILGITSWTGLCRLLRGETLKLTEMDYIEAANAFGVGHIKVMMRHLLPNVMHIILITVVLDFSGLVLAEAVLSYVGVGVDPSTISWGNMINSARLEMARDPIVWWSLVAAFIFMFILVLAANLFSDAVRDAFDPRLTRSK